MFRYVAPIYFFKKKPILYFSLDDFQLKQLLYSIKDVNLYMAKVMHSYSSHLSMNGLAGNAIESGTYMFT